MEYLMLIFDGKELRWQENQLLYRDNPLGEDKYQPIAFDSKARLYLDEGKVVFEYLTNTLGRESEYFLQKNYPRMIISLIYQKKDNIGIVSK